MATSYFLMTCGGSLSVQVTVFSEQILADLQFAPSFMGHVTLLLSSHAVVFTVLELP